MIQRLAILAFLTLAGVASAQYSDVRIHASRPTEQGPEVWLAESLPESLYTNCALWLPFPKAYTSTQYSFAVARATNDVTISGAVWTNLWGSTNFSGGMLFDGTDDILTTSSNFTAMPNGVSLCFWHIRQTSGKFSPIIGRWEVSNNQQAWAIYYTSANKLNFAVTENGQDTDRRDRITDSDSVANLWIFVCATFNAANQDMKIYTQGIERPISVGAYNSTISTLYSGTGRVTIANWGVGADIDFGGYIGEIAIFDRSITSNEQFNYYNQTRARYGL